MAGPRETSMASGPQEVQTRLFLEQLPVVFWSVDAAERFTSSLGAGLAALGLDADEVVGLTLSEYFGTDDPEMLPLQMHRRALAGESGTYTVPWRGRVYHSYVEPLRDEHGATCGVIGIAHDVTEQEQARLDLQASEERFQELANRIEEVFWMRDPARGEALYVSAAFRTIWGRDPSVCFEDGGAYLATVHVEDRERVRESFRAQRDGRATELEYRILRPDGSVRYILDRAYPVREEDGRVVRVCGVGIDVTRHHDNELELRRLQRLEAAGQVAGQIAHDFNNLLAPLAGYPALMRKWSADPDFQRLCDELEDSALRIAEINQQLLTLGRRGDYRRDPVDIGAVLRETLGRIEVPTDIELDVNLAPELPPVLGGAAQLERAFGNLLRNAIEAMPDGGRLSLSTELRPVLDPPSGMPTGTDRGRRVRVTIADTGPGIDPEICHRIFDPFFSTKEMDRARGSGLGLSVVHGVVEDHEGMLEVEANPGTGARFHIDLPVTTRAAELATSSAS